MKTVLFRIVCDLLVQAGTIHAFSNINIDFADACLYLKPAHLHQKLVAIAEPSHGKEELSELWQDLP